MKRSKEIRLALLGAVAAVSAAAAVLVAAIPFVTVLAARPDPAAPPAAPAPPSASGSPAAVQLTNGWSAPVFPYTMAATDGMTAPVASMTGGDVSAFFEATELREHADITVTVSARRPVFTTSATETRRQVRGHAGTLRTVDVSPAKQLTLYWKESADRWIRLDTDDTYTPGEVVALAGSLTGASVPVLPPFDLSLSPAGLVTDTVTASRMTFRAAGANTAGFTTVLRQRRQLTGINRRISGYDAVLTRRSGEVTLAVDVADWDATLEVTVGEGLTISDADLVRYAAGVKILNRSDPE